MGRRLAVVALFACTSIAALTAAPSQADGDKQLQNVKGSVSYQEPRQSPVPLGLNASIDVADRTYAITGASSLGAVTLADSSQVMVGSDSRVQLAFFNQARIARARFVIYNGRVRFSVRHPKGARANYVFTTLSGSVAVRGTQGDIEYDPNGSLLVAVYELCDPNRPVEVTLAGGRVYDVVAGQSFAARIVNGVLHAEVSALSQDLIDRFAPDFGVPPSWNQATGQVVAYAQNQATNAAAAAAPGYGAAIASGIAGLFKRAATPTPSPVPTPATCSS
jgi:hypothetical protein